MKSFKYPICVTSCRYLTKVGGRSQDLANDQVGLHLEALRLNTELSPNDRVLLDTVKEEKRETLQYEQLFMRNIFRIKPLRGVQSSHLSSISSDGEAILSPGAVKELDEGDEILLKSAVDKIPEDGLLRKYMSG
ncbi:hypothetical protein AKJ56_02370 [candidate division MSBL1 archaeon SCGC-AAA382N08]|uniref:Uncharacterized protein n=1 Tax=candidate division MSBL1 archaeon SCGC-AAA382N08 TaxID=1698285 RepID=A0A133VMV5_9EURY|nr:hypothetical protein AKJ56_02370 [candidate division MSBL1 archaeon SCGC-AAA382N08]